MRSAETSFLLRLQGTEVTTTAKPDFQLLTKTWIITERLGEVSSFTYQMDIDGGIPPGFAAGKFLCHLKDDPTKEPAFMRVYYQIPTHGTEWSSYAVRASQAVPPIELAELKAFQSLMKYACPAVPRLLGYNEGKQPDDGIVPGGYATTIVWQKVPGIPLSERYFWNLDRSQRDSIREEFRTVFEQLTQCGVQPFAPSFSKLVYDESTGKIHISGFRMAVPIDSTRPWTNKNYFTYGMAKAPDMPDRSDHEEKWEF